VVENTWKDQERDLHRRLEVGLDEKGAWEFNRREAYPDTLRTIRIWEDPSRYRSNHPNARDKDLRGIFGY